MPGITVDSNDGNGNITISAAGATDIEIPFSVPSGVTLTVRGANVTIKAAVTVTGGNLVVDDITVDASGSVAGGNGGSLNLSGTVANAGAIVTSAGGKTTYDAAITLSGTGSNVIEAGGTAYTQGDTIAFVGNNTSARYQLASGTFFLDASGSLPAYILEGTMTLNNVHTTGVGNDGTINDDYETVTINKGGVLIIGAGTLLELTKNTANPLVGDFTAGPAGADDPTIIVSATGTIDLNSSVDNFYTVRGTVATGSITDTVDITYIWDNNADNSNGDGWLKTP
jgi:hypothetical protein